MTEMVTSGSMSGDARRSDGRLGESGHESRRSQQAPPVLYATARVLDSTSDPPWKFSVEGESGSEADEHGGAGPAPPSHVSHGSLDQSAEDPGTLADIIGDLIVPLARVRAFA
jgi:hypothetical protein